MGEPDASRRAGSSFIKGHTDGLALLVALLSSKVMVTLPTSLGKDGRGRVPVFKINAVLTLLCIHKPVARGAHESLVAGEAKPFPGAVSA